MKGRLSPFVNDKFLMKEFKYSDEQLANYFTGELSAKEKLDIESWRNESSENELRFKDAHRVWKSLNLLDEMKQYDSSQALNAVNSRIKSISSWKENKFLIYWQRVAAILFVPLLILAAMYLFSEKTEMKNQLVWQSVSTAPGLKSQAELPDGTKVWLNSGSVLRYPSSFSGDLRTVEVEGEAFFDVAKDKNRPFLVKLGKIGIEVLGTKFNVQNFEDDDQTEIVLTEGKVQLFDQQKGREKIVSKLSPGELLVFSKTNNTVEKETVDTEKYTSWIHGQLIFRDDDMLDVARKLERWYNVEIEIADEEIVEYVYTATFQEETIDQIMKFIQKTSPIDYRSIPIKQLGNGRFEKQRIILTRK